MGYYSDVGLALRKKDYQAMLDGISDFTPSKKIREGFKDFILGDYKSEVERDGETIIVCQYIREGIKDFILGAYKSEVKRGGETIVVCQWKPVKWYDVFPAVEYITDFYLNKLEDFEFMRVGDDLGDVDECSEHENSDQWDIFGVSQSLVADI